MTLTSDSGPCFLVRATIVGFILVSFLSATRTMPRHCASSFVTRLGARRQLLYNNWVVETLDAVLQHAAQLDTIPLVDCCSIWRRCTCSCRPRTVHERDGMHPHGQMLVWICMNLVLNVYEQQTRSDSLKMFRSRRHQPLPQTEAVAWRRQVSKSLGDLTVCARAAGLPVQCSAQPQPTSGVGYSTGWRDANHTQLQGGLHGNQSLRVSSVPELHKSYR